MQTETPRPWLEIPVFIHGMTPDVNPLGHNTEYDSLLALVQRELRALSKPTFTERPLKVEWGWATGQTTSADEKLAEAERWLTEGVTAQEKHLRGTDWTFNPLSFARRWAREFLFYGIADMFYYVSEDGESTVRGRVFKYLANELLRVMAQENKNCSLTIFAHSGGTVITHDWLYHLHRSNIVEQAKGGDVTVNNTVLLREMVQRGKIRIRRLYTFGSPITPLALRSNGLITRFLEGKLLNPQDIGFTPDENLSGPRWLNFMDKDDFFSYPLSFMYASGAGKLVEDHFVDVGDTPISAHNGYWWSRDMARKIAFNF